MTLTVKNLEKRFNERVLFANVSFTVGPGRKVTLIGANGSGKTTLLNMIAGRQEIDGGKIIMPTRNFHVGIMEQFYPCDKKSTMLDDAINAGEEIIKLSENMASILQKLESENNPDIVSRLSEEYTLCESRFLILGGYNFEGEVRKLLKGIGFREEDCDKETVNLSGGERSRLALARLLIAKPQLLLLDEPTNHLDIESVEWLEGFIKEYKGGVLMVSHDRYFLDNVTQVILELEDGTITSYTGNYKDYLSQKCERIEREWKVYKKQQEEIRRLKIFIDRWRSDKRRASQAKSRAKILARMTPLKRPKRGQKQFTIHIDADQQSYTRVLEVKDATKAYAGKKLFANLNFELLKGEKFAIVGRNGEGKSTLLRCLMGMDKFDEGESTWGGNTQIGYFTQDNVKLDPKRNFLEAFLDNFPDWTSDESKQFLGRFYINLDDLDKLVASLSGGEKSKLAIAILIAKKPNVLILDEPTNHLDIIASEALEIALEEYRGTLILVSHDRRMLDRISERILFLKDGKSEIFPGNYTYMREKQTERIKGNDMVKRFQDVVPESKPLEKQKKKINIYKQKLIDELYARIIEYEEEIKARHKLMEDPEIGKNWMKLKEIQDEIRNYELEIETMQTEIDERERELYSMEK